MRRREFIALVGGAAASPLTVRAQQAVMPVVGNLSSGAVDTPFDRAFRQGLSEAGYVAGRNVVIEYRRSNGKNDELAALAADLASRGVAVIYALGVSAALAAKAATTTIPIVFSIGVDPVEVGLVASLKSPGGNITGNTNLNGQLLLKRLEQIHELVPTADTVGLLLNPTRNTADVEKNGMQEAARTLGLKLVVLNASTDPDFETAFSTLTQKGIGALVIGPDNFFLSRSVQLAALTVRHRVPAIFQYREFADAGGLISYGGNLNETAHLGGLYTGRILRGERPANLPVLQATKTELFINLKTAKALGIAVPTALLVRADEVIE